MAIAGIVREAADNLAGQVVGECQLSRSNHSDRFEKALGAVSLHHQSTRAKPDYLCIVCVRFRSGKHHGSYTIASTIQRAQDLKAIEIRHEQIKHKDVRMELLHHMKCFLTITGRTLYLEISLGSEQKRQ